MTRMLLPSFLSPKRRIKTSSFRPGMWSFLRHGTEKIALTSISEFIRIDGPVNEHDGTMSRDPELGLPPPTSPLATENSTSPEGPTSSDATVTMMFHGTTEMIPKDVRVITLAATIAFLLIVIIIMVAWIIRRKCVSTSVDRTSTNVDSVGTQVEIEAEPIGSNAAISPQGHYSGGVTTVVDQAIPQIWTNSENYLHATIPDDDHDYQQMAPPDEEDAYYENIGRTSPQNFN